MFFYTLLILFSLFSIILTLKLKNKSNFVLFALFVFTITCISIFRNNIGLDYFEYQKLYENVELNIDSLKTEPLFLLVSVCFRELGFKAQMMFAFYALGTMIFICKGCEYYSNHKYKIGMFFIIGYCINDLYWIGSLNLIRQMLAVAIIFYASKFIFEKNFMGFFSWVFIATLCHYTAIIGISLWYIEKIDMNKTTWLLVILLVIFLSETGLFAMCLEEVHLMLGNKLGDYELYFTKAYVRSSFLQGGTGLGVISNVSVYIALAFIANRKNEIQKFAINCLFIGSIIWIIFSNITPILRLRLYFWIFTLLIIAFNINKKLNSKNIITTYIVCMMSLLTLYNINLIPKFENNQYITHNTNKNIDYKLTIDFLK